MQVQAFKLPACSRVTGEKRSQVIENTLEPGSFFMKLRAPQALGRRYGKNLAAPEYFPYRRPTGSDLAHAPGRRNGAGKRKGDPMRSPLKPYDVKVLMLLLLPLYYPLAMRVATDHILGKFECEIRV